ncbi:MAG TPA: MFS transporter [Thermomicrobiaceae bacterium]|nr:MFS transporter [Thermomicrobiaceae bacterium]
MFGYFRQIGSYSREVKLFLLYNLFSNIGIGVFTLIYNLYLVQLGYRADFIGTFNAVTTISMAAAALVMGPVILRFGTWRCITLGTVFYVLTSAALSVFPASWAILVFALLSGIGAAFVTVPLMPFIVEWARPEARGTVAALTFSLNSLSVTVGSLIGGWSPAILAALLAVRVTDVPTYRLTLLLGLAVTAISLGPMWLMRQARDAVPPDMAPMISSVDSLTARRRVRRDVTAFILAGLLLSVGAGVILPFYNIFLESLGSPPGQIGMVFSLAGIVGAVFGLVAPVMSRRLGPLPAGLITRLVPIPAFALVAVSPGLGLAIVSYVLRATSGSVAWPIESTFMADVLPPRARANAYSLRSGAWNLGYAFASLLGGLIIVAGGYRPTFVLFTIFATASIAVYAGYFWWYYRDLSRGARAARAETVTSAR